MNTQHSFLRDVKAYIKYNYVDCRQRDSSDKTWSHYAQSFIDLIYNFTVSLFMFLYFTFITVHTLTLALNRDNSA